MVQDVGKLLVKVVKAEGLASSGLHINILLIFHEEASLEMMGLLKRIWR